MSLILLRHTRPMGAEGLCYGRTDLPLDDSFEAEAARLDADLPPIQRIISSPLSRCLRLAQALASARRLAVETDPRVIEIDFGRWEGRAWEEIPRADLEAWRADLANAIPHGGERVADLAHRTRLALDDAAVGPVPALVVTHSGVIKAALVASGDPQGWSAETTFGAWCALDWSRATGRGAKRA